MQLAKVLYSDFLSVIDAINAYREKAGVETKTAADFGVSLNGKANWSSVAAVDTEITYETSILKTGCGSHYTTYNSGQHTNNYSSHHSGQYSSEYGQCSHLSGNNSGYNNSALDSYKASHYSYNTYKSGYNSSRNTHNSGQHSGYCRSA